MNSESSWQFTQGNEHCSKPYGCLTEISLKFPHPYDLHSATHSHSVISAHYQYLSWHWNGTHKWGTQKYPNTPFSLKTVLNMSWSESYTCKCYKLLAKFVQQFDRPGGRLNVNKWKLKAKKSPKNPPNHPLNLGRGSTGPEAGLTRVITQNPHSTVQKIWAAIRQAQRPAQK